MLYWAEGGKSQSLTFVNSDPNMILLFLRFLREELLVDDSVITVRIICHAIDPQEIARIEQYWLDLTTLPHSRLGKAQIKHGSHTRKNEFKNGFCVLEVSRVELVHHIFGAIQEYAGFENPEWLVKGLSV